MSTSLLTLLVPRLEKQNCARGDYARHDILGSILHSSWLHLQGRQEVGFVIKNHDEIEANEANEADIDIEIEKEIKKETEKEKNKKILLGRKQTALLRPRPKKAQQG